jgi:hypothetical protein
MASVYNTKIGLCRADSVFLQKVSKPSTHLYSIIALRAPGNRIKGSQKLTHLQGVMTVKAITTS